MLDIERILSLMHDMQEMVCPDDELTETIESALPDIRSSIELSMDELEIISAAGSPDVINIDWNDTEN
ncbi:MAG: hypothetical protein K2G36_04550 [Ruminococcus sp.]|nr:hypothetical protein [Ruminococcus sp.]